MSNGFTEASQKRRGGERLVWNAAIQASVCVLQYVEPLSLFVLSDSGHGVAQVCRHGDHPPRHVASVSLHARPRSRRRALTGGPTGKESPSGMDQWEERRATGSSSHPSTATQPCTWALRILVRCHHWITFLLFLFFIHWYMYLCLYVSEVVLLRV